MNNTTDVKKKKGSEIGIGGHLYNAVANGVDYGLIKLDKLSEELNRLMYHAVMPVNPEMDELFEEYMDEQSGFREELANDIRARRELFDQYAEENPVKGLALTIPMSALETIGDPIQTAMNFAPIGWASRGALFAFNAITNGIEYLMEQDLIYDKQIGEYEQRDYLGLATSMGVGGTLGMMGDTKVDGIVEPLFKGTINGKPLPKGKTQQKIEDLAEKLHLIRTDKDKAPLQKAVEIGEAKGSDVDFKIQGEIIERIESGQTQSIPKGYHNGEKVTELIENGIEPKLKKIINAYNTSVLNNEYGERITLPDGTLIQPKDKLLKSDRDVAVPGAIAQAMAPVYKTIELGQEQALGEINNVLCGVLERNMQYDGITPAGDIISEIANSFPDNKAFVRMIRGKTEDMKENELSQVLTPYIVESISIKSKKDIVDKTEGYFFDTTIDKRNFSKRLIDLQTENFSEDDRVKFLATQLKDIGADIEAKSTAEKLRLFSLDINKTTKDHAEAYAKGVKEDPPMTFKEIGLKWGNMSPEDKAKFNAIEEKMKFSKEDNAVKAKVRGAKKHYDEILEKEKTQKLDKKDRNFKKWYEARVKELEEIVESKKLTPEEQEFRDWYITTCLDKLAGAFEGYEKPARDILADIFSTVVDERSGLNTFEEKFTQYIKTPITYKDRGVVDKVIGNTLGMKAAEDVDNQIKVNMQQAYENLKSSRKFKDRDFDQLGVADKTRENLKGIASYKMLLGIRHLKESITNATLINSGAISLGLEGKFNTHFNYIRSMWQMAKEHRLLVKKFKNITKEGLEAIKDPYERLAVEIYLRRKLENNYAYNNSSLSKAINKAGNIGGAGQGISDIARIVLAVRFTANALKDEFVKLTFDKMTPLMKSVLEANGIKNTDDLLKIQNQIKGFRNQLDFDNFILNTNIEKGGKLKALFEQFADIMGKEFEPFEKDLTKIDSSNIIGKLFIDTNLMFKRYSMGSVAKTWKNATTFYDSDGILRYKFISNKQLSIGKAFRKENLGNTFQGFGTKKTINLMEMSGLLWCYGMMVDWATGKATGTTQDEMIEAKLDALTSEPMPIIAEGIFKTISDYVGYDVMFGGTPALVGTAINEWKSYNLAMSSDHLDPEEKIFYSLLHLFGPANIGRGIDNIKFNKNIPNRLTTMSTDAQYLWKHYYKKEARREQLRGDLPIEKIAKWGMDTVTDWYSYYKKHPEKAEQVTGTYIDGEKSEEAVITLATGLTEMTENALREEHITYAFTSDDPVERERELKQFGLDYGSQLRRLDSNDRKMLNYALAFTGIDDPLYIIQALENVSSAKNRKRAIYSLLEEEQMEMFEEFYQFYESNPERRKEVASKGYTDDTEGYIEFLKTLRQAYYY